MNDRRITIQRRSMISTIFLIVTVLLFTAPAEAETGTVITPSHVFAIMDLADRCVDVILDVKGIKEIKTIRLMEKGIRPMHVYQMTIAAADMMIEFETKEKIIPLPRMVSSPMSYSPSNVRRLGEILVSEIQRIASVLNIENLPREENHFENKAPTDVFGKVMDVFIKFSVLAQKDQITPNETYAQMVRITSDVKSILDHIDPSHRYRIDAPESPKGLTSTAVFNECLIMRQDINALRKDFNMEIIPVPEIQADFVLHPADVFVQTLIIIAELNLIKLHTGTISATPISIPVFGKTPSDVHQQLAMARYLLSQVKTLQHMTASEKK